jgi:hypothetical protein
LFSIPLNCTYRLHNGSGRKPARYISCNTLPIIYNLFRNTEFVFNTSFDFGRVPSEKAALESVLYKPDAAREHTAVDLYETLFVPDVLAVQRSKFEERGEGVSGVYFEMGGSVISNHVVEVPGRRFYRPHRHGPSAFVFAIGGPGYSIICLDDAGHVERFDWAEDEIGVIVPTNMWWHGHFATNADVLTLAVKLRSRFFPISRLYDRSHKHISEGGSVRRYEDLAPGLRKEIWDTFAAECKRYGGTPILPVPAAVA